MLGEARPPLQDHEVRYHGQIIGLVVAASFEQARDAAALVTVDYDARTPNASFAGNHDRAVAPPPPACRSASRSTSSPTASARSTRPCAPAT
ncbi:hypothetical protein [Phytohabitans flavus]|uniref:hypothetical protein n=1 Tax=Phytohabitans flavus TaxID=1076124 RepID=UPI0022B2A9B1|nr:hypothetical protein [Phytohabitans flavus]